MADRPVTDSRGQAFYHRDGEVLQPTPLAAGPPWLPGTQHGSAIAALATRQAEQTPAAAAMQLARLTVDLSRAVPTGPTSVRASVSRDGRRVQVIDLEIVVAGEVKARACALRIRVEPGVVPAALLSPASAADRGGEPGSAALPAPFGPDPLWDAHSARWESYRPGAGSVWLLPQVPLVEGEELTPAVRATLCADLIMSGGGALPAAKYTVVNPDLSVFLERPPDEGWINVRSAVRIGTQGTGSGEGTLHDSHGRFARVCKSLLVTAR